MPTAKDIAGERFGRLVALRLADRASWNDRNRAEWICECDCGNATQTAGRDLRNGHTKSCGCYQRDQTAIATFGKTHTLKHGHVRGGTKSRTYVSWQNMRSRVSYPGFAQWKDYGGRGIKACERWESFENFLADMGERPEGKTLDRVDPDGDYELSNCRWATPLEQRHNRRTP